MKNRKFWMGMLVIVLTFGMMFVGCDDGSKDDDGSKNNNTGGNTGENTGISGGGKLTVTGIPSKYDGKYAYFGSIAYGSDDSDSSDTTWTIIGAQSINKSLESMKAAKISNGSVTLTLWIRDETSGKITAYTGTDTVDCMLAIVASDADTQPIAIGGIGLITFTGGNASKTMTDADFAEEGWHMGKEHHQ